MIDLLRLVTRAERPRLTALRPDLPPEIDAWAACALAINPDERYRYVSSMWHDLLRILMDGGTPSSRMIRANFHLPSPHSSSSGYAAPPSSSGYGGPPPSSGYGAAPHSNPGSGGYGPPPYSDPGSGGYGPPPYSEQGSGEYEAPPYGEQGSGGYEAPPYGEQGSDE
jgi:hypothetical protein